MTDAARSLAVYLHLARASDLRRQPFVTVKLLVLAGARALELKLPEIAEQCHAAILERNPRHLLRNWPNLAEAYSSEGFHSLLRQLRRQYTPEKAEHMLGSLGIDMARERELYANEQEYALALLEAVLRR
jgi:hypothetical protein